MGEEEVAAAAVAALFASRPRSFRMDPRSPEATRLKAAVSTKLVDFLGNYTDEVLAEYIVVLVCNGKHQNQARDDLEAFLGHDSEKFVAWLWHHLSEETSFLKASTGISDQKTDAWAVQSDAVSKEQKNGILTDLQMQSAATSDITLSKDGNHGFVNNFSALNSSCDLKVSEEDPKRSLRSAVLNNELRENGCRTVIPCDPHAGKNDDSIACKSTRVNSFDAPVYSEQSLQLEESYQKIGSSKSNDAPRVLSKQEPTRRNMLSGSTEDEHLRHQSLMEAASQRLSPEAIDSVSHQNIHPRGSVWDRLGKPREDINVLRNERMHHHDLDVMKRRKLDHSGEVFGVHSPGHPVGVRLSKRVMGETAFIENNHVRSISSNADIEGRGVDTVGTGHDVNFRNKRYLGDNNPGNGLGASSDDRDHLGDEGMYKKLQRSLPDRSTHKQRSKQVTAETGPHSEAACHSSKTAKVLHNLKPNEGSQPQVRLKLSGPTFSQDLAPVDGSVQSKSDPVNNPEQAAAHHKPVEDEVLKMKQRLHQIEREMLELRSKQASMNIDAKVTASQGNGLRNYPEEDAEVRTVFVTNVHFAASKEALSSHFVQCGPIIRVVLLTDAMTGQPKGSACVVFANKESAEKAMSLSGTSFFSRTLKVVSKADMPAGILSPNQAAKKLPNQAAGRPPQPWFSPQTHGKSSSQRQFSSHLQWRRDQASCAVNSVSAPTAHRPETSSDDGGGSVSAPTTHGLDPSPAGEYILKDSI